MPSFEVYPFDAPDAEVVTTVCLAFKNIKTKAAITQNTKAVFIIEINAKNSPNPTKGRMNAHFTSILCVVTDVMPLKATVWGCFPTVNI